MNEAAKDPAAPDPGRTRRAPPTIRLRATEIFNETRKAGDAAMESGRQETVGADAASAEPKFSASSSAFAEPKFSVEPENSAQSTSEKSTSEKPAPEPITAEQSPAGRHVPEKPKAAVSPWVVAPISGAVAAALVIGIGWMLGWPPVQRAEPPQANTATIDALAGRVGGLEARLAKPTGDPAEAARIATLEKSFAALREQSEKLAAQVDSVKSTPPAEGAAPAVDLSAITQRLDALERASHNEAETAKSDDTPLRRVVAASLLDLSVRQGDPFEATLAAAKALAPDADALKPLEGFASTGVPTTAHLSRELLTLVPKLSPSAPEDAAASNLVDRLQAGAQRLVRIQRSDATGTDRGAIVARVTGAALHNDFNEARRELKTLDPADRAPVQSWIDKADARDAALAASRQFAADAMAAFAKPMP
ncbi:MAG: hypothetical protein KGL35_11485 [Bradyrhizobium sp.]|nr:hypothetical protein [Bradyrhizobium sp.]